jgi:hypothetical protein
MANTCGLISANFEGSHGSGPISVPGLRAGDRVIYLVGNPLTAPTSFMGATNFEMIVSVDDELQQNSPSYLDGTPFEILVYRGF